MGFCWGRMDRISHGHLRIDDLGLHKNRGFELTYITRGRMEWVVDGLIEVVQQGDVFFTLPWQLHGSPVLQQPDNAAYHLLFRIAGGYRQPRERFGFPRALGLSASAAASLSASFAASRRHAWPASARIRELFPEMIRAFDAGDAVAEAEAWAQLRLILIELARRIEQGPPGGAEGGDSAGRVAAFLERLREDCGADWTLATMAAACDIGRTHFATLVRRVTGCAPMTYLARLRVDRARDLLRNPALGVTTIAFDCGFSSSQYFAKVFRKQVGLSPSEYRRVYPELYRLRTAPESVPWRTIEAERERVRRFRF